MDSTVQLFSVLLTGFILVSAENYQVHVETGSARGAGADANVYLTISGTKGHSDEKPLKKLFVRNFEAGSSDEFNLDLRDLGQITKIKIRQENKGVWPSWLLKKITIIGPSPKRKKYEFPCGCWLQKGELSKELTPANGPLAAPGSCSGIFSDASHCWQFDEASANVSPDLRGDEKAMLMDGADIVESNIRERVVSTLQKEGSWIDLGSFKGKCIGDPTMCRDGITMIFWAKISQQDLGPPQATFPKYILSSGGQDTKSRGFSLFHLHNKFVLKVLSDTQKWRMEIKDKIPLNKWFSFAFTWKKDIGLTYYIDGVKMGVKPQPEDVLLHLNDFSNLRIGKPNSNNDANQFLKLKFDQFVTWPRVLNDQEIMKAFNEGGGAPTVSNDAIPSINPCSPNPCANQGACLADKDKPEGYTCKCASGFAGLLCDIKEDEVAPTVSTNATTVSNPSVTTNISMVPTTTAGLTTNGPSTAVPTTAGPTSAGPTSARPTSAGPTSTGPTSARPTMAGKTTSGSTPQPTTQTPTSNATSPTTIQGSSTPTGTPTGTPTSTPMTSPTPTTGPKPDFKQVIKDILRAINLFRLLHKASLVSKSAEISQKANNWAQKLAVDGAEQIDPNSTYGALVCSHLGNDVAKACAVKWYGTIKDYDWAEPKLLVKASPFTQLVWKKSSHVGIGIAEGTSNIKRQNLGSGKYFVVVYFEPRQSDLQDIKENVFPATGISEPAPYASCPEGYEKLPQGSRSCFAVRSTPKSWEDAVAECARDNGTLASIECREEADLIVSMLTKENGTSEAWLGMHDRLSEGRYIWVDGSSIPFSEWLPGEPDGNEAENCIVQAKGYHAPGWADRNCLDKKAYVCRVPIPGYTTYKITLQVTEPRSQTDALSMTYMQSIYPGSYPTCPPVVQAPVVSAHLKYQEVSTKMADSQVIEDSCKELIRFFYAKNITVQPVVNTISCIANGTSTVEVILRLGPEVNPDTLQTLKDYVDQNDGILHLANGATARLISVDIINPGSSYCPTQCASACPIGCDPTCCSQTTPDIQYVGVQAPPIAQPYSYPAATQFEPQPLYPKHNPWECPLACTRNVNYCPPYCSHKCCKRRFKIHRF